MQANQRLLAHHFEDLGQQHEVAALGMWMFLVTEVLFFGALLAAYTVYRSLHPGEFVQASAHLKTMLGAVNTAVLIGSSLTVVLAVHFARDGRRTPLIWSLALTIGLGLAFLAIKATEYWLEYEEELVPVLRFNFGAHGWERGTVAGFVQLFFVFYFILTGLHAVHMLVGIGLMTILLVQAWRGRFSALYDTPVEVVGLYWHFVDIVWIFLFPLLYLVRH